MKHMRGLSLVELMISLVLGLVVTGSALALFMTNRQVFTATTSLGRVQESARMAFELMADDLRIAAGNPCDGRLVAANGLVDPSANWWSNWGQDISAGTVLQSGVLGYAGNDAFDDAAFGTSAGDRVDGTEAIEIKSAMPPAGGSIVTNALLSPGNDALEVNAVGDLEDGDLVMVCNFVNASIFHATNVASGPSGGSIEHGQGSSDWENEDDALSNVPTATVNYGPNSIVAVVHAARWYVGCNGRVDCDAPGGRSLYRATLVNNSGVPGEAVDEIVTGVVDMDLTYLADGAGDYVVAGAGGITDWNNAANAIVAIRATLTIEGEERVGTAGEALQRTLTHTVALRNRSP